MATLPMDMADLISRVREKAATRGLGAGSGLDADGDSDAAFLAARSGGGRLSLLILSPPRTGTQRTCPGCSS